MIVLDAAAVVDLLLDVGPNGEWAAEQILEADSLHAPHLIDVEVAGGVRRNVLNGSISRLRGHTALYDFLELRITRYPMTALLERIWGLGTVLTAPDASYVALAEALYAPVVTTDLRLGRAHGHRAEIRIPG